MNILFPVIQAVPPDKRLLKGREKVRFLSQYARAAAERSAEKAGIAIRQFSKDGKGTPLPSGGSYWSISHKPEYVAGVVSPNRIGIDIEKIRPYTKGLEKKVAAEKEWALYSLDRSELLFRFWTAKEAVLKTVGIGLAGLSACEIRKGPTRDTMTVRFENQDFYIQHLLFDNHVAAIVKEKDSRIEWTVDSLSI